MATQRTEVGEFSLIVTEVDKANLEQAAKDFAATFSLDEAIAAQILKSAPIIFAQKLTKSEVKAITPKLAELSKSGLEFRVTARVAQKIPKVNWPIRPQFTAGGSAGANGLAFEWDNNAFVCPGCGETFLFRRLGQLKLAEAPAAPAAAAAPSSATPAKAAPPVRRAAPEPETVDLADSGPAVQPMEGQLEGVEGGDPNAAGEPLELPDSVEEISLSDSDLSGPAASPAIPMDAAPLDAEPAIQAPDETAMPEGGELSAATEEAAAPAATEQRAPAGDLYNVFLSKITETSKRDKAAELIAKVKGCSTSEAKELTTRLVIPLAKNVSKEQAEEILNQFKKLKIFGRMTKVK